MYFVFLTMAAIIVGGMVAAASGRGGEMVASRRDLPSADWGIRSAGDVTALRLPLGLLGYQEHATGEVLAQVARMLADRDAEIAALRAQVRELGAGGADTGAAGRYPRLS